MRGNSFLPAVLKTLEDRENVGDTDRPSVLRSSLILSPSPMVARSAASHSTSHARKYLITDRRMPNVGDTEHRAVLDMTLQCRNAPKITPLESIGLLCYEINKV